MFASKRINADPAAPYVVAGYARNGRAVTWRGEARDEDHAVEQFDARYPNCDIHTFGQVPRREFDNDPNPILLAFRDYTAEADARSIAWAARLWLDLVKTGTTSRTDAPAAGAHYASIDAKWQHREHACRVLARLVKLAEADEVAEVAPERAALDALIALGPEVLATAILRASATAGALPEWDSETIEWVLGALNRPVSEAIPHAGDHTDYYTPIALALGIYGKDDLGIEEDPACFECEEELGEDDLEIGDDLCGACRPNNDQDEEN